MLLDSHERKQRTMDVGMVIFRRVRRFQQNLFTKNRVTARRQSRKPNTASPRFELRFGGSAEIGRGGFDLKLVLKPVIEISNPNA